MTDPILQAENERLRQELDAAQERLESFEARDTLYPSAEETPTGRHSHDAALANIYLLVEQLVQHTRGIVDGNKVDCVQGDSQLMREVKRINSRLDTIDANIELIVAHVRKHPLRDSVMPELKLVGPAE